MISQVAFRVNGAVAVCHNVPHGLDLPAKERRVLRPELVCQLAYQFTDLQDTESGSVAVDGVILKVSVLLPNRSTVCSIC